MNSSESSPLMSAACQRLRSKEMYHASSGGAADEFASGIYWCTKTHEAFGPDGEPAGRAECGPGRTCYHGWAAVDSPAPVRNK